MDSNSALAGLTITVTFRPYFSPLWLFRIMSLALLRSGSLSCSWRANSARVRVLSSLAQKTVTDIDVFFILLYVRVGSFLLQPSKLEIIKTTKPKPMPALSDMKFGHNFVSYGWKTSRKSLTVRRRTTCSPSLGYCNRVGEDPESVLVCQLPLIANSIVNLSSRWPSRT